MRKLEQLKNRLGSVEGSNKSFFSLNDRLSDVIRGGKNPVVNPDSTCDTCNCGCSSGTNGCCSNEGCNTKSMTNLECTNTGCTNGGC